MKDIYPIHRHPSSDSDYNIYPYSLCIYMTIYCLLTSSNFDWSWNISYVVLKNNPSNNCISTVFNQRSIKKILSAKSDLLSCAYFIRHLSKMNKFQVGLICIFCSICQFVVSDDVIDCPCSDISLCQPIEDLTRKEVG